MQIAVVIILALPKLQIAIIFTKEVYYSKISNSINSFRARVEGKAIASRTACECILDSERPVTSTAFSPVLRTGEFKHNIIATDSIAISTNLDTVTGLFAGTNSLILTL